MMKNLFAAFVLICVSVYAEASCTLTTPYTSGVLGGGTANYATATSTSHDWQANTVSITYSLGTVTQSAGIDSAFVVLAGAPTMTNTLNLATGYWAATTPYSGVPIAQGTLTAPQLAAAITVYTGPLTALRDAADYFACTVGQGNFLPGAQNDLWGVGDL